jgi:hypothetical protein
MFRYGKRKETLSLKGHPSLCQVKSQTNNLGIFRCGERKETRPTRRTSFSVSVKSQNPHGIFHYGEQNKMLPEEGHPSFFCQVN